MVSFDVQCFLGGLGGVESGFRFLRGAILFSCESRKVSLVVGGVLRVVFRSAACCGTVLE